MAASQNEMTPPNCQAALYLQNSSGAVVSQPGGRLNCFPNNKDFKVQGHLGVGSFSLNGYYPERGAKLVAMEMYETDLLLAKLLNRF